MSEEFKAGQDFYPNGGSASVGFNRRVFGDTRDECFQHLHERQDRSLYAGWELASSLIAQGRIFFVHNFHHSSGGCNGHAFQYGGTWVCNTCNQRDLAREWWKIKVYKDGSAWCCVGYGFENLQESDNYAFGSTRDEAIEGYGNLMKDTSHEYPNRAGLGRSALHSVR